LLSLPNREDATIVGMQYVELGVHHILIGYDHLLFVACLLFIARTWRRVMITITGFTLAHSVTLAISALGLVRLPVPPIEASIALSIIMLAAEIARNRWDTITYRYPVAVSVAFGLLHGFGFAAALAETGLPQTQIPMALFAFNCGIEIGQLLFAAAVLGALRGCELAWGWAQRHGGAAAPSFHLERVAAYGVGTVACYWLIERVAGFA